MAVDTGCRATIGGISHLPPTPTGGVVETCNCILTLTQPQREKKNNIISVIFHKISVLNNGKLCFSVKQMGTGKYRVRECERKHCNESCIRIGITSGHRVDLCYNIYELIL